MGIQAILNQAAINMLPKIKLAIDNAENFESNQMRCAAIKACSDCNICLDDMTSFQLSEFEDGLYDYFILQNWVK